MKTLYTLVLISFLAHAPYVAEEMKMQLDAKLAELGDSDPISTEKSLVKDN